MADAPWWIGAVSVIGGYGLKSAQDWFTHRWTADREREKRADDRAVQIAERKAAFQRQTLLELQEAALNLVRTAGRVNFEDHMALQQSGKWEHQLVTESVSDDHRVEQARTLMLSVRVSDETVSDLLTQLKEACSSVAWPRAPHQAIRR